MSETLALALIELTYKLAQSERELTLYDIRELILPRLSAHKSNLENLATVQEIGKRHEA